MKCHKHHSRLVNSMEQINNPDTQDERERNVIRNALRIEQTEQSQHYLSKDDGHEFLSQQIGLAPNENLCEEAKACASAVNYHKIALIIIGNMISPLNPTKSRQHSWKNVMDFIQDIRLRNDVNK